MIEALVRPCGPYRLHLMTYGKSPLTTPLPGGGTASAWQGDDGNAGAGQKAFLHRARMNGLARDGKWTPDAEKAAG